MRYYEYISQMWIHMVSKGHFTCLYFASKNFNDVNEAQRYRLEGIHRKKLPSSGWMIRHEL